VNSPWIQQTRTDPELLRQWAINVLINIGYLNKTENDADSTPKYAKDGERSVWIRPLEQALAESAVITMPDGLCVPALVDQVT
jgi:hypothetical protein